MNRNQKRSIDQYFKLLSSVDRHGIKKLIEWLQDPDNGFVDAPASRTRKRHHCYPGGLIDHSLKMYSALRNLIKKSKLKIPDKSVIIIALLHDICKVGTYQFVVESKKGAKFEYKRDDKYPIGHGDKSIIVVQQFIKLTMDEAMAIRWHMGPFDPAYVIYQESIRRVGYNKLVAAVFAADYISSQLT